MSIYRKIYVALYRLPAYRRLSPTAKLVLIGLLTAPGSLSVPGLFEGDASMLAGAIAVEPAIVESALEELRVAAQLIEVDADHGLIVVTWTGAYADEKPANPSVAKGWIKTFANVITCPARDRHLDRLVRLFPELAAHRVPQDVPHGGGDGVPQGVDTVTPFSSSSSSSSSSSKQQEIPAAAGGQGGSVGKPTQTPEQREHARKLREDTNALVAYFSERWVASEQPKDGAGPTLTTADRQQARALVRAHGLDEAQRLVDRYVVDPDSWLTARAHALRYLPGQIDRYRAGGARTNGVPARGPAGVGDFTNIAPGRHAI